MTRRPKTGEKYQQVAEAISRMPRQSRWWPESAACKGNEYGEGLDGSEELSTRRKLDRYFIGKYCSRCVVPRECFIDAVQRGETDAVRGGQPTLEVAKYALAYLEITKPPAEPA